MIVVIVALLLAASIDLLLAITLRDTPQRLGLARTHCLIVAAALASAFAPLILPGALLLIIALARRMIGRDAHA